MAEALSIQIDARTPSGDDGAATPSRTSRVPSLPDRVEQGSCHYPGIDEPCVLPPGTTSRRATLAAGLARYADGRPLLSIHVKSSAVRLVGDDKITTREFADGQKVFDGSSNAQ